MLGSLAAKCDQQIVARLQQAVLFSNNSNDPQRFLKAQEQILAARNLAKAFRLDAGRIDVTANQIQQVAAVSQPGIPAGGINVPPVDLVQSPPAFVSTGDPQRDRIRKAALEKLQSARIELSHGKTKQALLMAQELYRPEYGIQEEVQQLIRSINAEDANQQILEAKRL